MLKISEKSQKTQHNSPEFLQNLEKMIETFFFVYFFLAPSKHPTTSPTPNPTISPSKSPTSQTNAPSSPPTKKPTKFPSQAPISPSKSPTIQTHFPSLFPSKIPTEFPTKSPSNPSRNPSSSPSSPTTEIFSTSFSSLDPSIQTMLPFNAQKNSIASSEMVIIGLFALVFCCCLCAFLGICRKKREREKNTVVEVIEINSNRKWNKESLHTQTVLFHHEWVT